MLAPLALLLFYTPIFHYLLSLPVQYVDIFINNLSTVHSYVTENTQPSLVFVPSAQCIKILFSVTWTVPALNEKINLDTPITKEVGIDIIYT